MFGKRLCNAAFVAVIGAAFNLSVPSSASAVQPVCPSFGLTAAMSPMDKAAMNRLSSPNLSRVPGYFQSTSINSLAFTTEIPIANNVAPGRREFDAPRRALFHRNRFGRVIPDSVTTLFLRTPDGVLEFPDSVFVEAKAQIKRTVGNLGDYEWESFGYLDYLRNFSPAGISTIVPGAIPDLIFVTSSDVVRVDLITLTVATRRRVAIWHGIACYENVPNRTRTYMQISEQEIQNPLVYVLYFGVPEPRFAGYPVFFPPPTYVPGNP